MAAQNVPMRRHSLTVEVETSPAYEFLMSLGVFINACEDFHHETTYDVGKSWFDDVRAKASPELAENIEQFSFHFHELWEHVFGLTYDCPPPRDIPTLLAYMEKIDPLELRLYLLGYYVREHRRVTPPEIIYAAAQGDSEAQKQFLKTSFPDDAEWQKTLRWLLALDMTATKNILLEILHNWYEQVFREQELFILPILARDVEAKRALKATLSPEQLIETCTGWEYVPEPGIKRVTLIPSYLNRPYNWDSRYHDTRIFYYPVADESIAAGTGAPPVRLLRMAKALADERRLRILKKLSAGSYTLQELADDFGVAKSTMHHHLVTLRTAGLVRMRLSDNRYGLRQDVIDSLGDLLGAYLK